MVKNRRSLIFIVLVSLLMSGPALATEVGGYMDFLKEEAKRANPEFRDFSAKRGEEFFNNEVDHPEEPFKRSCFTCHTRDLKQTGTHHVSGKLIEPLAPSVNSKRLTEVKKVKKWFKRNCKWVLQRACSPVEKGDFLVFIQSK